MLNELNNIKNPTIRERLDRLIVKPLIGTKLFLGIGINEAEQLANELHKPYRKPPILLKVKVFNPDDIWSADLVEMPPDNLGRSGKYKFILTIIDLYTRYAWAIALKNKTATEVKNAFDSIFKSSKRIPKKLWCDSGKEFYNSTMKQFLKQHNIELYSTMNEGKAVVIERFNRTLKQMMYKQFTVNGDKKWVKLLPSLLKTYNNKVHSSINMTPTEASNNPDKLKERNFENNYENELRTKKQKPKFKVGDRVRIYKYRGTFSKGYKIKWSSEIFVISEVMNTSPTTYRIKD